MNEVKSRLTALRKAMTGKGITAYYITTADFHASEYVNDYFKVREFFSGFTGSNGDLLVLPERAILWTDGRYFVQAEKELEGSGIELFKMGEEGVPEVKDFIAETLKKGETLGFDGRTVSTSFGRKLSKLAGEKGFMLKYDEDITEGIFNRPPFPVSKAEVLGEELTGESVSSKLKRVRKKLKKNNADALFLTKLDDIAYLFNIRGGDIRYNPVLMSYALITGEKSVLFINPGAETEELLSHLKETDTLLMGYDEILKRLDGLKKKDRVMLDPQGVSFSIYQRISSRHPVILKANPTEKMKAVKNERELKNMKRVCLLDSAALTRFILHLVNSRDIKEYTEESASDLLLSYRKEIRGFRDLSFSTISAYGENAAMMHYEPGKEEVKLQRSAFLLEDSGAQYSGGTTDVTRTIVLGRLTKEAKRDYTLTACSMLNLLNVKWLKGCTGRNLDIIARQRMWENGMDYKCGTGHGIGYMLNVHEGPQNIRWKIGNKEAELLPGMIVSDEPGVYKAGKYGIRIENLLAVKNWKKTPDGQFLEFENLTFAPIDDAGIDKSIMSERELKYYLDYQKAVCKALKPYLSEEEFDQLKRYAGTG